MLRSRIREGRLNRYEGHNQPMFGLVLIGLGAAFMFGNFTGFYFENWWALFILIPGAAALLRAYDLYRAAGQLTPAAGGSLVSGLGFVTVAAIFLLGLSWGLLWPLLLVLVGVGMFFNPSQAR